MNVLASDVREAVQQEINRLEFCIRRDGIESALKFAETTMRTYRRVIVFRKTHGIAHRKNRHAFIASYRVFRYFLKYKHLNIL